jgi:hypothetical protein
MSAKRQRPAASSSSHSSLAVDASLLECSICNNPFDETVRLPRLLPCGHHFCTACLASWVKRKAAEGKHTIACPIDGAESDVKNGDATTLATNFGSLPLIAAAHRPPPPVPATGSSSGDVACELCEEKHDATHRCLECQQCVCDTMSKAHRRMSGSMAHRIVSLAEWRANPHLPAGNGAAAPIVHLCKSHGKPADLFDLNCGLFLCAQCVLSHGDHLPRIKSVGDSATVCRAELDAWIGRCEHWAQRIAATDKACDVRGDEVERVHDRAKDQLEAEEKKVRMSDRPMDLARQMKLLTILSLIVSCPWQIHAAVTNRFQVLHRQLGAAGYAKQDPLSEQRGRLKDLRAQSTSVLTRARSARAEASDASCVMAFAELVGSLEALDMPALPIAAAGAAAVEVLEVPVSTSSLRVALDPTGVLAAIGSLGVVQVCQQSA